MGRKKEKEREKERKNEGKNEREKERKKEKGGVDPLFVVAAVLKQTDDEWPPEQQ